MFLNAIHEGDALDILKYWPSQSIDCCITSPPYWQLRDYKTYKQLGKEPTYDYYLIRLIDIFREVHRMLKPTGSCWVVMGDTYNGSKKGNTNNRQKAGVNDMPITKHCQDILPNKTLCMIPERFAMSMVEQLNFCLRNKIIWFKRNAMPNSAPDRFGNDYEYVYFFTKKPRGYYYEQQYRPLAQSTIKEMQKQYNGKAVKDYEGSGAQNPSDVKRRIIRYGGNKAKGYGNPRYSGKEYIVKKINTRPGLNTGKGKSGTDSDPNANLHNSDLSKYRQSYVREDLSDGSLYGSVMRSVWDIPVKGYRGAHFAVFPEALVERILKSGCPEGGLVLDPFFGAGTVGVVAERMNRSYIGIELNPDYIKLAQARL